MTLNAPLGPPPRKAYLSRGVRNARRAYRTVFALIVIVFGGWFVLDAFRWNELSIDEKSLAAVFGILAAMTLAVWLFVERPMSRDLRLARRGIAVQAVLKSINRPRGKHGRITITYAFRTEAGTEVESTCGLPRRIAVQSLEAGMPIEVVYHPRNPAINKLRFTLSGIEFGEPAKKQP